jgi:hypothetical protein
MRPRRGLLVFKLGDLLVFMTELLIDGLLACEQTDLSAIEPRRHQIVDGLLERASVVEHANDLTRLTLFVFDRH